MNTIIDKTFELGQVMITPNAADHLDPYDIKLALSRHTQCDWGELSTEDWESNNQAVLKGNDRIFSSYRTIDDTKYWVITEWDRSYTTILMPEDY